MQNKISVKTPSPQNISKWSIGRKGIIKNNKFLKNQLDSKNLIISNMKKEIDELNIKVKLNGMIIPKNLYRSVEVQFEFELINSDDESLTYNVSNSELEYNNEVEVYYSDIIEHFKDEEITDYKLKQFISENIIDSLYF
jgi:hypothetical protein